MIKVFQMTHDSASATITQPEKKMAIISNFHSKMHQMGHGSSLMEKICRWADENELRLLLTVQRYGHPIGPSNADLIKFYKRFGFEEISNTRPVMMARPAKIAGNTRPIIEK